MLARRSKGQLQLFPLTLGFDFSAADAGLKFQQFQLCVGEFLAPGPVRLDPHQTQSFFQYPDLIFRESESILKKGQRAVEFFEQRLRKLVSELTYQLRIRDLDGSKTAAQLMKITNKYRVTFIVVF